MKAPTEPSPVDRPALIALLRKIRLPRTCNVVPAVIDQLRDAGDGPIRTLVFNGLPTQPEFALPGAMTRLALEDMHAGCARLSLGRGETHADRPGSARPAIVPIMAADFASPWHKRTAASRHQAAPQPLPPGRPHHARPKAFRGAAGRWASLPTQAQRLIVDPVSCWAIGRFLRTGQPLMERPVQIFIQSAAQGQPRAAAGDGASGGTAAGVLQPPPYRLSESTSDRQWNVDGPRGRSRCDAALMPSRSRLPFASPRTGRSRPLVWPAAGAWMYVLQVSRRSI